MNNRLNVLLVGRKNVGKSTLFNRLSDNVKSITLDYEGVTRDFIKDEICWQGSCFNLIDSGGISFKKSQDPMEEKVRNIAVSLLDDADIILFVVDGKIGLVPEDREIANVLHKSGKPVLLIINKVDHSLADEHQYEFERLGFKESFAISAEHGFAIGDFLDALVAKVQATPVKDREPEPKCKVVLLGKPNVGKSSLMNVLLDRERTIVSDIPGTTREAISEPISFYKETILVTDTPGIRRKRGVTETLEGLMVKSSFRAIEQADIVLLMIDGSAGNLSDQERKLAFYAFEKNKALILLINKDDIIDEVKHDDLKRDFELYQFLLKKVPQLYISCKSKKNIGKILPLVNKVWQRYTQEFSNEELTYLFKKSLERRPLFYQGNRLFVDNVKQIKTRPPILVLFVNQPQYFGDSQLAFFENILRKEYDLLGVPVVLIPRKL